jgi:hypothetical protein
MSRLPTVVVSSVVRSAHQGESHGGLYLLDLETGARRRMVDWNICDISWEGRGLDRGLRGVAFQDEEIWVAAADELFVYDQAFVRLRSYRNPYLAHCHEICCDGARLYLTSTGYDSVLEFDFTVGRFTRGWTIRGRQTGTGQVELSYSTFDPNADGGPERGDTIHINNVQAENGAIHVSALRLPVLLQISGGQLTQAARLPVKTHNARPYRGGLLLNNTGRERGEYHAADRPGPVVYPVPAFDRATLVNGDLPSDHAQVGFARGLCVSDGPAPVLALGSSPATVTAFELETGRRLARWTLTNDVRHAVHGLAVWPFAVPQLDPAPGEQVRELTPTPAPN